MAKVAREGRTDTYRELISWIPLGAFHKSQYAQGGGFQYLPRREKGFGRLRIGQILLGSKRQGPESGYRCEALSVPDFLRGA